jgi:hypothetical protein
MCGYQVSQLGHVYSLYHYVLVLVDVSLRSRKEMLLKYGYARSCNLRHDYSDMGASNLFPVPTNQLYRYCTRTLLLAHGTDHVLLFGVRFRNLCDL